MYNIEYQKHFSIQSFALCIILQETCDMSHVIPIGSVGGLTWFGRNFFLSCHLVYLQVLTLHLPILLVASSHHFKADQKASRKMTRDISAD